MTVCLALVFSVTDVKVVDLWLQIEDSSAVALLLDGLIACLCC